MAAPPTVEALPDYDYWLFDLDGTLVDVEWAYVRWAFDRVGRILDRPFTDREAELLWYGFGRSRDARLREWGVDPERFWPAFYEAEDAQVRAQATYLHEDAAFVGALDRPVGLVTHCQPFLACPVLDRLDIGDWFDAVVFCSDEVGWKPDPEPVERARSTLGASGRGVLVGDASDDVGAAWNAGLDAVHVERHGHDRRGGCVIADRRVRSFANLGS